jgi:DNA-directed RNA polymerase subunit RPC12/RpoP
MSGIRASGASVFRQCLGTDAKQNGPGISRAAVVVGGWGGRMAKLIKARRKSASLKHTYIEPITCPHCGGQASLMRRTLHPKIKGEILTFECNDCGKQTEKSKLHSTE